MPAEDLLPVAAGEHDGAVREGRRGEREGELEHVRFARDVLELVDAQRLVAGEVRMLPHGRERPLREGLAVPCVVGIRGVGGQAAEPEHDRAQVVDIHEPAAPAHHAPKLLGHEHVPAGEQGGHVEVAGEPHGRLDEQEALAGAGRAVEVEVRVGLEQLEREPLLCEQSGFADAAVAPVVGLAAPCGEVGEKRGGDLGHVLGGHAGRVERDLVDLAEPGRVLIDHLLYEPGGFVEILLPAELPLEELEVAGGAVDELVAAEGGEPEEPGDRLVAAQDARLLEMPAQAAAGAVKLLERILAGLGRAVEVPAPVLVLDVGGRFGLDDDDAAARDEHEKVDLPTQPGLMPPDRQRVDDDPVRPIQDAREGGEERPLGPVRLGAGLGRDHAGHGFTLSRRLVRSL